MPRDIFMNAGLNLSGELTSGDSSDTDAVINLKSGNSDDCLINMYENDVLKWTLRNQGDNSDRFYIQSSGGAVEKRFTIEQDGNVGIGTTNPGQKLHVGDGVESNLFIQVQQNGGSMYIGQSSIDKFGLPGGEAHIIQAISKPFGIGTQTSSNVVIGTDNQPRIHINSTGEVGVGTTSPTQLLDVSGNVNAEHYYVNGNVGFTGSGNFTTFTIENGIITSAS